MSIRREYRKKIEKKNKKNILLSCVRFLGVKLGVKKCPRTLYNIPLSSSSNTFYVVAFTLFRNLLRTTNETKSVKNKSGLINKDNQQI